MLSVNALTRLLKANATTSPTATTTTSPRIRKFLNPLNISIPPDPEYTILGGFLLHWEILNTPEGVQEWGEVRFLLVGEAYRKPFALEIRSIGRCRRQAVAEIRPVCCQSRIGRLNLPISAHWPAIGRAAWIGDFECLPGQQAFGSLLRKAGTVQLGPPVASRPARRVSPASAGITPFYAPTRQPARAGQGAGSLATGYGPAARGARPRRA